MYFVQIFFDLIKKNNNNKNNVKKNTWFVNTVEMNRNGLFFLKLYFVVKSTKIRFHATKCMHFGKLTKIQNKSTNQHGKH